MELAGKKPGMILDFDEPTKAPSGEVEITKLFPSAHVVHIELKTMAVPLEDLSGPDLMRESVFAKRTDRFQSHGSAFFVMSL
jgi:hypothetical protein